MLLHEPFEVDLAVAALVREDADDDDAGAFGGDADHVDDVRGGVDDESDGRSIHLTKRNRAAARPANDVDRVSSVELMSSP
jgi:hypothetical protein